MPDFLDVLLREIDARNQRGKDFRLARVMGRNADGTEQLQRLDGECIARGSQADHYTGEVVRIEPFPARRDGFTGLPVALRMSGLEVIWLVAIDPDGYSQGASVTVAVVGRGFSIATRIEYLMDEGGTVNEDVVIVSTLFLDEEHLTLEIEVAPDAFLVDLYPIAYGNV